MKLNINYLGVLSSEQKLKVKVKFDMMISLDLIFKFLLSCYYDFIIQ